jgi:hypothetical protein
MVIRTQKTAAFPLQDAPGLGLSATEHKQLNKINRDLPNGHDIYGYHTYHNFIFTLQDDETIAFLDNFWTT